MTTLHHVPKSEWIARCALEIEALSQHSMDEELSLGFVTDWAGAIWASKGGVACPEEAAQEAVNEALRIKPV